MIEESRPLTEQMLRDLIREVEDHQPTPHVCIVHPKGGFCLGCGQPWRLVDGRMQRVVP